MVTLVGFLTSVAPHVRLERGLVTEGLATLSALHSLLHQMHTHVPPSGQVVTKDLATGRTLIVPFLRMNLAVRCEVGAGAEGLATQVTAVGLLASV